MEVYVAPGEDSSSVPLTRASLLSLMQEHGLDGTPADEGQPLPSGKILWTVGFPDSDIRLVLQEDHGSLVFATIVQSMFDATDLPDRICAALASAGWRADSENVG
jgi:hypothetical protein